MRFRLEQPVAGPVARVTRSFCDPAFYEQLGAVGPLTAPVVVGHDARGPIDSLQVRYGFAGSLSAAARRIVDPAKLTWVTDYETDLERETGRFTMLPDHYQNRLECSGTYAFHGDGNRTLQVVEGDLKVHVPLVAGTVERVLVDGLRDHLAASADPLARWRPAAPRSSRTSKEPRRS